jgi:glycosyltransferase involved in cell wall biosynthesis
VASRSKLGSSRRKSGPTLAESFPVSIIIPVHDGAPFLRKTLEALLENDLGRTELIIVDDGSTDQTPALIQEFADRVKLESVRHETARGPAAARNAGAARANLPYLLFLDADVLLPPGALDHLRETLDLYSHRPDVAGALGCYAEELSSSGFCSRFKNLSTTFLYRVTATQSPYLHTAIFLVRRDVFALSGGFDERLLKAEDFKLGLALGSRGYRFVIDRRVEGIHLKEYTLGGILREDWSRIVALRRLTMTRAERKFSFRAHRPGRILSLALPGPILLLALGGVFLGPWSVWTASGLALLFVLLNLRFLRYVRRRRGWGFTLLSLGMAFVEMLWAEGAVVAGSLGKAPQGSTRPGTVG